MQAGAASVYSLNDLCSSGPCNDATGNGKCIQTSATAYSCLCNPLNTGASCQNAATLTPCDSVDCGVGTCGVTDDQIGHYCACTSTNLTVACGRKVSVIEFQVVFRRQPLWHQALFIRRHLHRSGQRFIHLCLLESLYECHMSKYLHWNIFRLGNFFSIQSLLREQMCEWWHLHPILRLARQHFHLWMYFWLERNIVWGGEILLRRDTVSERGRMWGYHRSSEQLQLHVHSAMDWLKLHNWLAFREIS